MVMRLPENAMVNAMQAYNSAWGLGRPSKFIAEHG